VTLELGRQNACRRLEVGEPPMGTAAFRVPLREVP
jgi:hypothetical protein